MTAVIVLSMISSNQGKIPTFIANFVWQLFGWGGLLVPIALGGTSFYLILWGMGQPPTIPRGRLAGTIGLFITFEAFASMTAARAGTIYLDVWSVAQDGLGGGYLGAATSGFFLNLFGTLGAAFTFFILGIVAAIFALEVTREDFTLFIQQIQDWRQYRLEAAANRVPIPAHKTLRGQPAVAQQSPLPLNGTPPPPINRRNQAAPTAAEATTNQPVVASRSTSSKPAPQPSTTNTNQPTTNHTPDPAWQLPLINEIMAPGTTQEVNNASIREQVGIIEHTLVSFGAPAKVVEINQGPSVTQFGVEPQFIEMRNGKRTKVKVGKIANLADDLALALSAQAIRIQAPVPGKGYVGIEVPNTDTAVVSLRDVIESRQYQKINSPLRIGLGQNVAGNPIAANLADMPHLLIAGTTGSGKSVCVNAIIACLLLQNTPETLKLVMVDPKRVELTGYNGIPHLAAPVIVDPDRVVGTLQWALREMDNRYQLFSQIGARNIIEFNKRLDRLPENRRTPLPYIVIIIDELADLMMLAPEETERGITRLAQMARATGIHMVIATQRPSVDVVTGLIKANFPARIAFAVASSTDSRVILDTTGAERLLGKGDMLFQSPDAAAPVRMQGCYVSEDELQDLIDYWRTARRFNLVRPELKPAGPRQLAPQPTQNGKPAPATPPTTPAPAKKPTTATSKPDPTAKPPLSTPAPTPPPTNGNVKLPEQRPLWAALEKFEEEKQQEELFEDDLMPDAILYIRKRQKASTSMLQRHFRIGYTRAARMMDALEDAEIIGPPTGTSKAREVLLPKPTPDELRNAKNNTPKAL